LIAPSNDNQLQLIDDTTIVNVNKNSSILSGSTTDNNDSELSGNFNAKHNNESTIGSNFTNVSINDNNNYDNFNCPPVTSSKFIKKESYDD
jgi:hypothetical protein